MTPPRTPVVILASIDPLAREVALTNALLDRPDAVAIVHDLDPETSLLRRRISGPLRGTEEQEVHLDHLCPSCAVREDAGPVIADLIADDSVGAVLLALPVSAELEPASAGLNPYLHPEGPLAGAFLSATVAVVEPATLGADLLGQATVLERGCPLAADDDRTLAEALLGQVPQADAVLQIGQDDAGAELVRALRAPDSVLWPDVHSTWLPAALAGRHDVRRATNRKSLRHPLPPEDAEDQGAESPHGVWCLELRTPTAMHPQRLIDAAADLADGPRAFWGTCWVPDRPHTCCGMLGAGRRVALGVLEEDAGQRPCTAIRVVGMGAGREETLALLHGCLVTAQEAAAEPRTWLHGVDELEPFLGPRSQHAPER